MLKTLIIYSSVDGQTKKICQYIVDTLQNNEQSSNSKIELIKFSDFAKDPDFNAYDTIVIGASIRYGKHRKDVMQFIEQYKFELDNMNTAFFSVNLVARKPEKNTAETSPYMIKFLEKTHWKPTLLDVFAGQVDYSKYGFFDKIMIKFIMWMTKGPTKSDKPIEFTNWARVTQFANKLLALK